MLALLYLALVSLLSLTSVHAQTAGTITAPSQGAKIMPLQSFPFSYKIHQDYCTSSHNITVQLTTKALDSGGTTGNTGHYFGRFATGSYPYQGLPNPNPPVPSSLTMPDFSMAPGGFGTGATASNLPLYLHVIEEWNTCQPTIGNNIFVSTVQVFYNSTS
ncbi:SubName: Full=Uncharacterized protein {ECO:0000313/EMBL:CCA70606.1} [Serendipita indica DSM 11827]|nr:SubName: Full=Uncharacterized protein {ECO:0000313/EMBL:CCA70606.1} [Serendipita indica DSM 11827]